MDNPSGLTFSSTCIKDTEKASVCSFALVHLIITDKESDCNYFIFCVDVLNCTANVNRPRSLGRLLLNTSATTLEDRLSPVLDLNLFSDESDYDVLIEGVLFFHYR